MTEGNRPADLAACSAEELIALLETALRAEAQAFLHGRSFGKGTTVEEARMGARVILEQQGIHDPEVIRAFIALRAAR